MQKTRLSVFLFLLILLSCRKLPDYPLYPVISFENPDLYVSIKETDMDSIVLNLYFQDGDGNIGLEASDTLAPYHPYDFVLDGEGNRIKKDSTETFNIYRHVIIGSDTYLIKNNVFYNNILIDFLEVNDSDEVIDTLDFENFLPGGIPNYNGRIEPLYKKDFTNEVYEGPIEGYINYALVSFSFPSGKWKIRAQLIDRSLNISNEAVSSTITIE